MVPDAPAEHATRERREAAKGRFPWAGVPAAFRVAGVLEYLARSESIAIGSVAEAANELVAEGAVADAARVLEALEDAIDRTEEEPPPGPEFAYARELVALPKSFPEELRKQLALAAASSNFEEAIRAVRRYRVLHFLEGPALMATLRRWAPVLTRKIVPTRTPSTAYKAGVLAAILTGIGLAFSMGTHLLHVSHFVPDGQPKHGPTWTEPSGQTPLDGMRESARYLQLRAEYLGMSKLRVAAEALQGALQEQPVDCAAVIRRTAGVNESLAHANSGDLQTLIGPKLFLLRTLPTLCPPQSASPTESVVNPSR